MRRQLQARATLHSIALTSFPFHSRLEPTNDRLVLGSRRDGLIPRCYLFWGDQVGFKFPSPLHCLSNAFLSVFEFPGRGLAPSLDESLAKWGTHHLAALMYRGIVSGLSKNLSSHG